MRQIIFLGLTLLLSACHVVVPTVSTRGPNPALVEAPGRQDSFGRALNAYRASHGLPPVSLNTTLTRAARTQSQEMRKMRRVIHFDSRGADLKTRTNRAGYQLCFANENLAQGIDEPLRVLDAWKNSPKHRNNLLSNRVTEYGIAHTGDWYTLIMASRC